MPSEFDLFAPAFDPNDPASVAVWEAWKRRNLSMTRPLVEETRSPVSFNTGDPRGMVDPEALKAHAQGLPYDIDAKRNAIAAQLVRNRPQRHPRHKCRQAAAVRISAVGLKAVIPIRSRGRHRTTSEEAANE